MEKNKKIPDKFKLWIDARKKYHLSNEHIQMARELGMNPKKFGSLANNDQEPWKVPLPEFIKDCYYKRFKKRAPDKVISEDFFIIFLFQLVLIEYFCFSFKSHTILSYYLYPVSP